MQDTRFSKLYSPKNVPPNVKVLLVVFLPGGSAQLLPCNFWGVGANNKGITMLPPDPWLH